MRRPENKQAALLIEESMPRGTLMTIGHSTLPIEVFLRSLKENGCDGWSTCVAIRGRGGTRSSGKSDCSHRSLRRRFAVCGGKRWAADGKQLRRA
jgi:hypothetical protein